MAIILKKQKSLYWAALKYIILAFLVAIIGRLLISVSVFITIISFFIFFFLFNKSLNYLVGALGEYLVTKEIKKFGDDYFLINDVKILGKQTDHILICPKGIYVIETKTYFFNIYGWAGNRYWKFYKNGQPKEKHSPIYQVVQNAINLKNLLQDNGVYINWVKAIVIFAGSVRPKVRGLEYNQTSVWHRKELYNKLSQQDDILSWEEVLKYKEGIMKVVR